MKILKITLIAFPVVCLIAGVAMAEPDKGKGHDKAAEHENHGAVAKAAAHENHGAAAKAATHEAKTRR